MSRTRAHKPARLLDENVPSRVYNSHVRKHRKVRYSCRCGACEYNKGHWGKDGYVIRAIRKRQARREIAEQLA